MSDNLARLFRPIRFSDVIGQSHVVVPLKNALKSSRIPPAILFHGPPGTGKTTLARIIARRLNCAKPNEEDACGECRPCKQISADASPHCVEMDAATRTGVDEVRELQEQINSSTLAGGYRVFILDEAHMLSRNAGNALLKTLEEPPKNVLFILATTEPNKVLPAVRSRCQQYALAPLKLTEIKTKLAEISQSIGLKIEPGALDIISRGSKGGMRDALQFLDKCRNANQTNQITSRDVIQVFGTVNFEMLAGFFRHINNNNSAGVVEYIDKIAKDGVSLDAFWADFQGLLRDMNIVRHTSTPGYVDYDEVNYKKLEAQSKRVSATVLLDAWNLSLNTLERLGMPSTTGRLRETIEETSLRLALMPWKSSSPTLIASPPPAEVPTEEKLHVPSLPVFGNKFQPYS